MSKLQCIVHSEGIISNAVKRQVHNQFIIKLIDLAKHAQIVMRLVTATDTPFDTAKSNCPENPDSTHCNHEASILKLLLDCFSPGISSFLE